MQACEEDLRFGHLIHDVSRLCGRCSTADCCRWVSPGRNCGCWPFLSRNDGMPQTDLAAELDVGKVALGALIDPLSSQV